MKKVLFFSILLALALNVLQYGVAAQQREAATTSPPWVFDAPAPSAKLAKASPAAPTPTPASSGSVEAVSARLAKSKMKTQFAGLYLAVEAKTGVPWELLAAVHKVETGQAGSTSRASYAGAIGPMQFMPATFRSYGVDGDGDGTRQITDLEDAMFSAGRYLAANGAAKGNYQNALYRYNHSWSYVNKVLSFARPLGL